MARGRRRWRAIFDRRSRQVGFVEQDADDGLWYAWVGARYVGSFGSEDAARSFVVRIAGESDTSGAVAITMPAVTSMVAGTVAITSGVR